MGVADPIPQYLAAPTSENRIELLMNRRGFREILRPVIPCQLQPT